jgi:hypothetical protein
MFSQHRRILLVLLAFAAIHAAMPVVAFGDPPKANTTSFGPNVYVFDPKMPDADIEKAAKDIFAKMEKNHFGPERYALLFKPGKYKVDFNVGFYTHVAGLGRNPDDVLIDGALTINAKWADGMALDNFWRTVENLAILPSSDVPWKNTKGVTRIAVSQAAPLRRLHVKGELQLFDWGSKGNVGYASGGFLADSVVDGDVVPASQQQWLSRNSTWKKWNNAVWNMVFVGCENAPEGKFPNPAYTVVDKTPVIREKPYLFVDGSGDYRVFVPALKTDTRGVSWLAGPTPGEAISLDDFYVAQPNEATAEHINAALAKGKHILFTPGVYSLNDTLRITKPDTIVFGLGVPSLVPTKGLPILSVADVGGVKITGLILDAGPVKSPTLLEVGPAESKADHSANPTFLYDLTVRTGGPAAGENDVGVLINSRHVVADQLWIWRADHGAGVGWTTNPTKNGLVVNGKDVTIYGLFNEHHGEYQTLWNGNGGSVYFYQSEMPYDPPSQGDWMEPSGANGYASYKVADGVTSHMGQGIGVYSVFTNDVQAANAVETPTGAGVSMHHLITVSLASGSIDHILNGTGGTVAQGGSMTAKSAD